MKNRYNRVRESYFLGVLNDIRFRKFSCERIEDTYTATLTYYRGHARHVTVPWIFDDCAIYELGPRLFNNNRRVRSVKVSQGVRIICEDCFEDCVNLKKLELPASLEHFYGQPFAGCESLRKIVIHPDNKSLKLIDGMLIESFSGRLVFCLIRSDECITVPEGVRIITKYAFMHCKQMKKIILPDSVDKIEPCAFTGSGLTEFPVLKPKPDIVFPFDIRSFLSAAKVVPGSEAEELLQRSGLVKTGDTPDENGFIRYEAERID